MRKTLLLECEKLYKINNNYDIIDFALIDYMQMICGSNNSKLKKIKIGDKVFTWVAYQKIITDMPYIKINSKDVIGRRLKQMIKDKLLEKYLDKEGGNKTFWGMADKWDILTGILPYDFKNGTLPLSKSEPLTTSKSDNISINNNTSIKIIKRFSDTGLSLPEHLNDQEFIEKYNEWIAYRKEKRAVLTMSTIKKQLKSLSKYSLGIGLLAIDTAIEKGWQGFFPENIKPSQVKINTEKKGFGFKDYQG